LIESASLIDHAGRKSVLSDKFFVWRQRYSYSKQRTETKEWTKRRPSDVSSQSYWHTLQPGANINSIAHQASSAHQRLRR
jgi:hypothetical protein